jgi:hypothetical protein
MTCVDSSNCNKGQRHVSRIILFYFQEELSRYIIMSRYSDRELQTVCNYSHWSTLVFWNDMTIIFSFINAVNVTEMYRQYNNPELPLIQVYKSIQLPLSIRVFIQVVQFNQLHPTCRIWVSHIGAKWHCMFRQKLIDSLENRTASIIRIKK